MEGGRRAVAATSVGVWCGCGYVCVSGGGGPGGGLEGSRSLGLLRLKPSSAQRLLQSQPWAVAKAAVAALDCCDCCSCSLSRRSLGLFCCNRSLGLLRRLQLQP
jgi:hypothetical protein